MSPDADDALDLESMFPVTQEPPRPPSPEPTFAVYSREKTGDWSEIKIRLVGNHPLWAHHLWNAAIALASYLDAPENLELYRSLNVLELGAGGALPSIVAAKNGAAKVVITDYPDRQLIENIEHNIDIQGYVWGQPIDSLGPSGDFQLIILSDLIFNHSQHDALLKTCKASLSPVSSSQTHPPSVLVFYTHHRPHLAHRDMEFFTKAREDGWLCEEILTRKVSEPMFPEDSGSEEVRSTIHGWKMTRSST
ncbi:nicotinamide N-methyltransferase [Mycena floridula]|nr:nicotinamide N-methyltransferase [Mycena floridula]